MRNQLLCRYPEPFFVDSYFDVQIPAAMKLHKASNDNKAPATHEEFMEKIIKPGRIDLPQLPPGERYLYDPKKEELMVEQRK